MVKYVKENQPKKALLVTECTMSDNVQVEKPKCPIYLSHNSVSYEKNYTECLRLPKNKFNEC